RHHLLRNLRRLCLEQSAGVAEERSPLATYAFAGLGRDGEPRLECTVVVDQRGVVRLPPFSTARSGPNVGTRAKGGAAHQCGCSGRDGLPFCDGGLDAKYLGRGTSAYSGFRRVSVRRSALPR